MQELHYTIYKTTNLVNGKVYIGKHITSDLDDGYLGSGKLLRRAIKKYGVEYFHKEILHVFDNEADMNAKERELVTEDFVLQETNYNLCVGGHGGFSYLNSNKISVNNFENPKTQRKASKLGNEIKQILFVTDPKWAMQYSQNISTGLKKHYEDSVGHFTGKTHTEDSKLKMSVSSKGKSTGDKNSQFGTRWITDGKVSKKIKKTDAIPNGWHLGRKINRA
jgi:hypothetical protein